MEGRRQRFQESRGQEGVDNQLYRALGCINSYRGPQGANDFFDNEEIGKDDYNRLILEISGIETLTDSQNVTVTVLSRSRSAAGGCRGNELLPGGTQRIDLRWGSRFVQRFHGKIEGGVLTTEPGDLAFPWATFGLPADEYMHDARLRIRLTPTEAEGMIAGYVDLETWYLQTMKSESTHHQSYGQLSPPSLYKAFRKVADAYPGCNSGGEYGHIIGPSCEVRPGLCTPGTERRDRGGTRPTARPAIRRAAEVTPPFMRNRMDVAKIGSL